MILAVRLNARLVIDHKKHNLSLILIPCKTDVICLIMRDEAR